MLRRCEKSECQVTGDLNAVVDRSAMTEAIPVSRRVGASIIAILLSVLAVWLALSWLRPSHAVLRSAHQCPGDRDSSLSWLRPSYAVPEVVETIPLEENAQPIAVAVNPNDNYVYVVNIGTGTVSVINGTELVTTIDLKVVDKPATACPVDTPYGSCLNAVGINRVTNHVYVTEWYYDVAQIISGTEVIDWVYAGKGPAGVVPHPDNDSIYALDKWTPGVTVIQGDQDRVFISGSEPNAGVVDPRTGYVYIADSGSDSVAVISNLTKIADIPVGSYPNAITYSPHTGYIYVVNSGSSPATVSVISGTQVITGPIPVGTSHTNLGVGGFWGTERDGSTQIIAAHPGGYVYVANWVSNTVSIISNTQWITDVVVGINPNSVGVNPVTGYVYVANIGSDSVSVIRGTSVITTVTVGDYPFHLAVNPTTGYVYAANRDEDSVSILAAQAPGVEIGPNHTQQVQAGQNIIYNHILANTGTTTDTFLLEFLSAQDWPTELLGGAYPTETLVLPLQVGPQMTVSFQVNLTVPPDVASATETTIITATSQINPTVYDIAIDTTIAWRSLVYLPLVIRGRWSSRFITFSGYEWEVKSGDFPVGPGPNYFSDQVEDVWVDESGRLHLRIVQRDGRWYCTEVFTEEPLGYGKYVFHIASRVDQLDKNVVLGLFTWDDTAPEHNYREIDIEFAKWGQSANDNAQYVVQPWHHAENMHRFNMELGGDDSTHGFDWREDRVFFQSLHGHQPFPGSEDDEIESWTYTGGDIPPAGAGNARINLWLSSGIPPSDDEAVEVIIEAFEFVPQTE